MLYSVLQKTITRETMRIPANFLTFLLVVIMTFSGCSGKSKDRQSMVEYGNPSYKHVKDLPVNTMSLSTELVDKSEKMLQEMNEGEFERIGDAHLSRRKLHMAYVNYEKALEKEPGNQRVEYKKGITLLVGKNYTEAITIFNGLIQKDPTFAQAYEGLGRAYFLEKDYENAEIHFKKACELNPDLWLSRGYLGQIYDSQKNHYAAIKEYQAAIALAPDRGFLYNNLGFSYFMAGQYPEAVKAYQKAIGTGLATSKLYNNTGLALAAMERYDDALEYFKKAVGEARAYNNLGAIYLSNRKYKEAADCFEKAVAISPVFYVEANDRLQQARKELGASY